MQDLVLQHRLQGVWTVSRDKDLCCSCSTPKDQSAAGASTGVTLTWPQKGGLSRRQHSSSTLDSHPSATAASSSATAAESASRLSSSARTGRPSASLRLKPARGA